MPKDGSPYFQHTSYLYRTVSVQRIENNTCLSRASIPKDFILINDLFQLLNVVSRVNTKPFELVGEVPLRGYRKMSQPERIVKISSKCTTIGSYAMLPQPCNSPFGGPNIPPIAQINSCAMVPTASDHTSLQGGYYSKLPTNLPSTYGSHSSLSYFGRR